MHKKVEQIFLMVKYATWLLWSGVHLPTTSHGSWLTSRITSDPTSITTTPHLAHKNYTKDKISANVSFTTCLSGPLWRDGRKNTKYSQNVTCVCKNILSVKHILLECPFTTELFQKNGYDLHAYNNVRDILYNTDVITNIVRSFVHSPVGKLV